MLHLCGERYLRGLRRRDRAPDYRLLPWTDDFGAALAAADLVLARAGGSVWEVAAAGKPAVLVPSPNVTADHQTKNARYFEAAGGAVVVAGAGARRACRRSSARCSPTRARLAAMGEAMRRAREAGRGRRDRGGADRACSRLTAGASGSSGSAAPGSRRTALLAQAWGAEVGGWDRNETPYLAPVRARRDRGARVARVRRCPRAGRCSCRARTRASRAAPRAELLAELVVAAAVRSSSPARTARRRRRR